MWASTMTACSPLAAARTSDFQRANVVQIALEELHVWMEEIVITAAPADQCQSDKPGAKQFAEHR
jgi:hypothetical protein